MLTEDQASHKWNCTNTNMTIICMPIKYDVIRLALFQLKHNLYTLNDETLPVVLCTKGWFRQPNKTYQPDLRIKKLCCFLNCQRVPKCMNINYYLEFSLIYLQKCKSVFVYRVTTFEKYSIFKTTK